MRPGDKCVRFDPAAVRPEIGRYFGRSLQLREVCAGGDASVEMELNATGNVNFDLGRYGILRSRTRWRRQIGRAHV